MLDKYQNPKTKQEHINELHHILVQTCLNYMKEHELTDIDEVSFSADGLSSSYEYNEWTPATDSSLIILVVIISPTLVLIRRGIIVVPSGIIASL